MLVVEMVSDPPHLMESVEKRQRFFVSARTGPFAVGEGSGNSLDDSEHSLSRYCPERGGDGSRRGHLEPAR